MIKRCWWLLEPISHGSIILPFLGESPSSSASDVDNMNNIATMDKVSVTKGVNSPQVAGNHVIPARSRPNFTRLLNFVSTCRIVFLI